MTCNCCEEQAEVWCSWGSEENSHEDVFCTKHANELENVLKCTTFWYKAKPLKWFGVKVLYNAVDESEIARLAEEVVFLISAKDAEQAIGNVPKDRNLDDGFNVNGDICFWTFDKVLDIYEMFDAPVDGVEVYSRIIQPWQENLLKDSYDNEHSHDEGGES